VGILFSVGELIVNIATEVLENALLQKSQMIDQATPRNSTVNTKSLTSRDNDVVNVVSLIASEIQRSYLIGIVATTSPVSLSSNYAPRSPTSSLSMRRNTFGSYGVVEPI